MVVNDLYMGCGKINKIGNCSVIFVDKKGNKLKNKKFFISSIDNIKFAKIEPRFYTSDSDGKIFFESVMEHKILIEIVNSKGKTYKQFHSLKIGITECRISISIGLDYFSQIFGSFFNFILIFNFFIFLLYKNYENFLFSQFRKIF